MQVNEDVVVLLSGTLPNFSDEMHEWLKSEKLASVKVEVEEDGKSAVCHMARDVAKNLRRLLEKSDRRPYFVNAVFPREVVDSAPETVLKGPARVAQEAAIAKLPAMTATPESKKR